jgi:mRNA interferase HicA
MSISKEGYKILAVGLIILLILNIIVNILLKDKDLLKLLINNGWEDRRQRGSHHRLVKDDQFEVIAVHGKDVPIGLLNAILKRTGLK